MAVEAVVTIPTTTATATLSTVEILRGGNVRPTSSSSIFSRIIPSWLGGQPSPPSYRQVLEEQIAVLEIQLRQSQDQIVLLKQQRTVTLAEKRIAMNQYKSKKKLRFVVKEDEVDEEAAAKAAEEHRQVLTSYEEQVTNLQQQLENMQTQLKALESLKVELQDLLQAATKRIQELEKDLLFIQDENNMKIIQQQEEQKQQQKLYEEQITSLQLRLQEATEIASQYETKERLKLEEASTTTKQSQQKKNDNGDQQEDKISIVEFEIQLQQLRKELEQTFAKELAQERQRGQLAVEMEKQKMRKLVKALALREKRLMKQAQKEQKQLGKITETTQADLEEAKAIIGTSAQQLQEPKSPPTTRGFR